MAKKKGRKGKTHSGGTRWRPRETGVTESVPEASALTGTPDRGAFQWHLELVRAELPSPSPPQLPAWGLPQSLVLGPVFQAGFTSLQLPLYTPMASDMLMNFKKLRHKTPKYLIIGDRLEVA